MSDFVQITTTSDKKEILETIADRLIDDRLAGCVQISGPIESFYSWEGKKEVSSEWVCSIKTVARHQSSIESVVREIHNYDVPQFVAVEICNGSQDYLDWIRTQTTAD